jgi:hypothetical protein
VHDPVLTVNLLTCRNTVLLAVRSVGSTDKPPLLAAVSLAGFVVAGLISGQVGARWGEYDSEIVHFLQAKYDRPFPPGLVDTQLLLSGGGTRRQRCLSVAIRISGFQTGGIAWLDISAITGCSGRDTGYSGRPVIRV